MFCPGSNDIGKKGVAAVCREEKEAELNVELEAGKSVLY